MTTKNTTKSVTTTTPIIAKIDSGASKNYFRQCDTEALVNVKSTNGPTVLMPDNNGIHITKQGNIPLPSMIKGPATMAYVLPGLKNASLLSLGQFMNSGCWALVNSHLLNIYKDSTLVVQGRRNWKDGLWDVKLLRKQPSTKELLHYVNAFIQVNKTKSQLANYLHACLFSPCTSTLQKAIQKNFLLTWPGIDKINFQTLVGNSIATAKGHMAQERKNLRSTKPEDVDQKELMDYFPEKEKLSKILFSKVLPYTPKELAYGDLTDRFPFRSSRGNEYIYVVYDYDSNAILVEPIQNRQAKTITEAWEKIYKRLTKN